MRRRTKAHRAITVGAAIVLVGATWVSTASAEPGTTARIDQVSTLSELKAAVEQDSARFAGLYVDVPSNTVHVNVATARHERNTLSRSLERLTLAPMKATPGHKNRDNPNVVVHETKYSADDLRKVMREVTSNRSWVAKTKDIRSSWHIDPRTNKVVMGLTSVTPELREESTRLFGDKVRLTTEERYRSMVDVTPVPDDTRRVRIDGSSNQERTPGAAAAAPQAGPPLVDFEPYGGGVRMWRLVDRTGPQSHVLECTAGFEWHNGGNVYSMSSAGHCGPVNYPWTQGYFDQDTNTLYETGPIGTPYVNGFGQGGIDGMLMDNGNWIPFIWENTDGSYNLASVDYVYDAAEGQYVCFNGSVTGSKCSGMVTVDDGCFDIIHVIPETGEEVTVTTCNLTLAESTVERIVQWGDSGGPVSYGVPADGVGATGIISAGNESGTIGLYANRAGMGRHFTGDFSH